MQKVKVELPKTLVIAGTIDISTHFLIRNNEN